MFRDTGTGSPATVKEEGPALHAYPARVASLAYTADAETSAALPNAHPQHLADHQAVRITGDVRKRVQIRPGPDPVRPPLANHDMNTRNGPYMDRWRALSASSPGSNLVESFARRISSPSREQKLGSPVVITPSEPLPDSPGSVKAVSPRFHVGLAPPHSLDDADKENEQFRRRQRILALPDQGPQIHVPLGHHHQSFEEPSKNDRRVSRATVLSSNSDSQNSSSTGDVTYPPQFLRPDGHFSHHSLSSPSSNSLGSDSYQRGRTHSPHFHVRGSPSVSPYRNARALSSSRRSPDSRPLSYIDLLNAPYPQQRAPVPALNNALLKDAVGSSASLLDSRQTLEMYRSNVKKTNDEEIQYEFAVLLINIARESPETSPTSRSPSPRSGADTSERTQMISEAKHILHGLAGRSYPFAQYLLADGYASGLFSKGKEDHHSAFPLFVAAAKHGHAEAAYRAALCYEFGWGSRKDYAKAVQFYRQAASKSHPGAATRMGKACLSGDMGFGVRHREGLKWLKRAAESADIYHNSAPYELGLLHEHGYGDDVFKDETYAASLFTQAADLGHGIANLRMGEAYEHGLLGCPRDPALSVHFYNAAALAGTPEAMMALCAWYMVGAEPVLEKNESEAYEWAKRAAAAGFTKAEYAVGYFTEMGIGCRRDPLEANVWYVRAADKGDERAKQRLALIRAAASGDPGIPPSQRKSSGKLRTKKSFVGVGGGEHQDKDCRIM